MSKVQQLAALLFKLKAESKKLSDFLDKREIEGKEGDYFLMIGKLQEKTSLIDILEKIVY